MAPSKPTRQITPIEGGSIRSINSIGHNGETCADEQSIGRADIAYKRDFPNALETAKYFTRSMSPMDANVSPQMISLE